ncbi:hypothetical protein UNSWDHB_2577 [Dehalobacter sp. UNSWDHB]|jgi:hypothetical protein|uniref:DUF1292 domain-containing protein n=1 Tax=unclassified Dehalobacter TaxID=2635733 RepID=UPI00028AE417|nr:MULTISPECIES: DUF1292 domain-containing protein [unclassified Dehalobacter]AFV03432.1 hypothetical protein DHBDCA_p2405 [Dehalobacter sp. DCA]AFV06420.1 hypothetical protein DCF50_p2417 [Dehalobacter sp. CF]EQB20108.1 hypothetical protein UNSWDHB_2577 [Dehalobacter sp. UNSWDHB]
MTENLNYTDEEGVQFVMSIIKRFSYEEKDFVVAIERDKHHHEGKDCSCHEKGHTHTESEDSEEEALYVFEWSEGPEGGKLVSVNDGTLQQLNSILNELF